MKSIQATAIMAAVFVGSITLAPLAQAGDAAKGKAVYKKCSVCHSLEAGKKKLGPTLAGLFGRAAGGLDGYKYSKDMKAAGAAGLVWSEETLAGYIKKDGKKGPKNYIGALIGKPKAKIKMAFPGLKTDQEVADLIAYLNASGAAATN